MAERADLIVVGAGPGGSATAYHAAKAGLEVFLLDRQEFPRDKPCGDGLMPHAAEEISLMGLGDWLDEPHHGKFSAFSVYTQTAFLRQKVPPTLPRPVRLHPPPGGARPPPRRTCEGGRSRVPGRSPRHRTPPNT